MKNCKCPNCKSDNVGPTAVEYLDTLKDYFCYDCNKDFNIEKKVLTKTSEFKFN